MAFILGVVFGIIICFGWFRRHPRFKMQFDEKGNLRIERVGNPFSEMFTGNWDSLVEYVQYHSCEDRWKKL